MQASIQPFAIGEVSIRQLDGLFSLNDLHRASGGEEKHKPALFLRNDQAQALIEQLGKGTDLHLFLNTVKGRNGGTYACRELVIAYAAWISAAFHLKVIRVFLDATAPTTITPAQQQHLKELVDLIAESGRQTHGETWARLHRKFGVPRYTELPAARFDDACQYLHGKLDTPAIATLVQKHLPQAAPPSITGRRWLVSFDHQGREQHVAMDDDHCLIKYAELPALLLAPDAHFQPELLAAIAIAGIQRLQTTLDRALESNRLLRQTLRKGNPPPALSA